MFLLVAAEDVPIVCFICSTCTYSFT